MKRYTLLASGVVVVAIAAVALLWPKLNAAQAGHISDELHSLPEATGGARDGAIISISRQIRAMPVGNEQVHLAYGLCRSALEGDPGHDALQAAVDVLADALNRTPQPDEDSRPAAPYVALARYLMFEGVTTDLHSPQLQRAKTLVQEQAMQAAQADFHLPGANLPDGETVAALKGHAGKVVLVNFWATWCGPCREELPALERLLAEYPDKLVVLAVTDESPQAAQAGMRRLHLTLPVVFDEGGSVFQEFGVTERPQTFVFDAEGKLAAYASGSRNEDGMRRMLHAAGLGQNPAANVNGM